MRYIINNKRSGQLYGMFLHPVTRQRVYRSIGTTDEIAAARTSQALQQFIADQSWHTPTKVHDAVKIDAAAARLFYDPLQPQDYSWFAAHGTFCNWATQDETGGWVDEIITIEEAVKRAREIEGKDAAKDARISELEEQVRQKDATIAALLEKCGSIVVTNKTYAEAAKAYLEWGRAQGGRNDGPWSADHSRKREAIIWWWQAAIELESLADVTFEKVDRVVTRTLSKKSRGTVAKYQEGIAALISWCVDRGYLTKDPLAALSHLKAESETEKRAMTPAEAQRFVCKCQSARKLLYLTALCSGFRANELRQTTVRQLLDKGLAVSGAVAKSRKKDYVPLPKFLIELLRSEAAGKEPGDRLLFVPKHLDRGFAADLKRAEIEQETDEGKLTFHALRTTYLTWLHDLGANVAQTQALARHSTPVITFERYVKTRSDELGGFAERVGDRLLGTSAGTSAGLA